MRAIKGSEQDHGHDSHFDVVVVGDLNVDLTLTGDVTPVFGQTEKLIDDATLTIGGSSLIFACGAARLGLRVAFMGKVGDDVFGQFIIHELAARTIDTTGIIVDPTIKTGLSINLSRDTDRAILTYSGSIGALRYDEIDDHILEHARHLHLGSYFLLDALRPDAARLFQLAHDRQLTTSLDTNYDPREEWDGGLTNVLRHVDIFLPNQTELFKITHLTELDHALEAISKSGAMVVVKRGADGAVAHHASEIIYADPISVSVVDTTGAGDSFDAGFIYGYLLGWPIARSLQMGCICGALSSRAVGGTAAQVGVAEALTYLDAAHEKRN